MELELLAKQWIDAKRAENDANTARLAIEKSICDALEVRPEGAITHKIDGFKIVLDQPVTRKLDVVAWEKVKTKIPAELWPIKIATTADATGCKYLANNEPDLWRKIAGAFETKPGKVSVKVEAV